MLTKIGPVVAGGFQIGPISVRGKTLIKKTVYVSQFYWINKSKQNIQVKLCDAQKHVIHISDLPPMEDVLANFELQRSTGLWWKADHRGAVGGVLICV